MLISGVFLSSSFNQSVHVMMRERLFSGIVCSKARTALGGGIHPSHISGVGQFEVLVGYFNFQEIVLITLYQEKKSIRDEKFNTIKASIFSEENCEGFS